MYTLLMRMVWFPTIESAFALAVATTLAWSGWLALHHDITIGAATTVTLYVVQINDPIDRIVSWLDELQVGQTSWRASWACRRCATTARPKASSRKTRPSP